MFALERVLNRREPGRFQVPLLTAVYAGFVLWSTLWLRAGMSFSALWNFIALLNFQLLSMVGTQRATRAVARDQLARPLLGALPIAPRDTLAAKVRTLRIALLTLCSPLALSVISLVERGDPVAELLWRLPAWALGVAIYAEAVTYVAFLTTGLGTPQPRGGVFGSFESLLVAVPFASVTFAPGPGTAALSLATLAALTFEARRAALKTIDWLDDPDGEPSTEVWKALVVFGVFQGAQVLALQLTGVFGVTLTTTVRSLLAYLVAGAALWILTVRGQRTGRPEHRARLALLGLLGGALSAFVAWAYLRWLPGAKGPGLGGSSEAVLLAVVIVGLAPIVEERFFRGWLQLALERALGARGYLGPLIAALTFAAAHPVGSFVPVFVLGLVNGFLMWRFRSLSACMVAHALHNALALYFVS